MKASKYKLSSELKALFVYIRETIGRRYRLGEIDVPSFLLGVMEFEGCNAHKKVKRLMLSSDFSSLREELVQVHKEDMASRSPDNGEYQLAEFNERFDAVLKAGDSTVIDSCEFLSVLMRTNAFAAMTFGKYSVTPAQLSKGKEDNPRKSKNTQQKAQQNNGVVQKVNTVPFKKTIVDDALLCLNELAEKGAIGTVIGNSSIYDKIFTTWARCERNNVVLVGKHGVGKTATIRHIANMIVNDDVPVQFRGKRLMQLNLVDLMPPNGIKGFFEEKYKSIIDMAASRDCYIFYIDDIRTAIGETVHFSDMGNEAIMDMMLSNPNILFVCTADENDYSTLIDANPFFKRRLTKIVLEEKTEEECVEVVNATKKKYEDFHNVKFSPEFVQAVVKMSKKHISSCVYPDTIYDIIDEVGAIYSVNSNEDEKLDELRGCLQVQYAERENAIANPSKYNGEDIDRIENNILELSNKFMEATKQAALNTKYTEVSTDVLKRVISERCNKDISDIGQGERERLKSLSKRLSAVVIGQDEAVDKVARVVKRSRTGLSRTGRPPVFLFVGSTGTGKTLLAKKLAEIVFGDEKSMVRLDMSEYADKTSVNKLYGSSPGYIGYEKGGVLTEAVKKNGHCVILLDEIEKAADEVHDTLLQVFDDGRLTDNKGVTVNFNDTIIIMTSNVGASEADERGQGLGFVKDEELGRSIFLRSVRRKFKPEFINRIDDIVLFNKLSDDELDKITHIEVGNCVDRIRSAGYKIEDNFSEKAENVVRSHIDGNRYGARPIPSMAEKLVMDVVSDYVIENNITEGGAIPTCILEEKTV